jgi:transposase-like protein
MQKNKRTNKKYSPEFKISVILNMIEENLSRSETVRRYWGTTTKEEASKYRSTVLKWERKYLKEGI